MATTTTSLLTRVFHVYSCCSQMVAAHVTYEYGANHGNPDFRTAWETNRRVDCSSGVSIALSAGGLLGDPRPVYALDTAEFMTWGEPGEGRYLTVYVRNDQVEEHCGLRFTGRPEFAHEWWQAANPEVGVGWITLDTAGMIARHIPGT